MKRLFYRRNLGKVRLFYAFFSEGFIRHAYCGVKSPENADCELRLEGKTTLLPAMPLIASNQAGGHGSAIIEGYSTTISNSDSNALGINPP